MMFGRSWLAIVSVLAMLAAACGSSNERSTSPTAGAASSVNRSALKPVSLPDLSRSDSALRERLQAAYSSLQMTRERSDAPDAEVASAYGELGRLLMSAEFLSEAETCLLNAQALQPSDLRWPYFLGHLHRLGSDPAKAIPFFEQALRVKADDAPALVWLGRLNIERGDVDEAARLFDKALSVQPGSAAALAGLGQVAMGRRQHRDAVKQFEAALAADPRGLAVHYPLALAYRALGNTRQADVHLQQWKDVEMPVNDPLMNEVGGLLQTSLDYALRGTSALDRQRYPEAAALFRKGLEGAPRDPTLHLNLGTAVFLSGDHQTALTHFQEAVRLSPGYARAHFAIGVTMQTQGRDSEAIEELTRAVTYDPGLVDARFTLADALRRVGRPEASLEHYKAIVSADPSASQARFGYAMALVRLKRYQEARAAFEEAVQAHPDQVGFIHALARILAAAPDDRVRDGRRALEIAQRLDRSFRNLAVSETLAMAQAEAGRFDQAVATQRALISEARRANQLGLVGRLSENLGLYERQTPCRTPWRDDDPVHRPSPPSGFTR